VRESWDARIRRAEALTTANAGVAPLLAFYSRVLTAQSAVDEFLKARLPWKPSGSIVRDLTVIRPGLVELVRATGAHAPEPLTEQAKHLLEAPASTFEDALVTWWRAPTDQQFFPKAALQPYLEYLARTRVEPTDRGLPHADNRCPFCAGQPQLSVLHRDSTGNGGGRSLMCANCFTAWSYNRVCCASCGEADEPKLGYFRSDAFVHVRVDMCDACKRYLKSIDLTRLGLAVPFVDEVASAPLDAWALEQGYTKLELNLLGF